MNDDLIIQALGGKPGDVLVRNPDGSATLQEGPKPSNPSVTNQLDMIGQAANNALNAFGLGAAYDTAKGAVDVAQGKDTLGNKLNAGLLGFRQGVLPAGGAVAGGMAGAKVPGPPLVKIIGGLVGSIAGGIGAGRAQDVVQKEFFPQASAEYEQAAQQFPWSTRIGGLVPSALTGRFGLDNVKSVARVARNVARTSPTVALREAVASGDAANAINAAAGVGIPTAAAYNQYKATGEFDPSVVLDVAAGVGQTGFNKPLSRALGIPYGPSYQAQTREQLRQGLDKLAPLNVDTAQPSPYDIPVADTVSKDAGELGYSEPEKLAADMGKGRETSYKTSKNLVAPFNERLPELVKQPVKDQLKMEQQRLAAQKQIEEAELSRRASAEQTRLNNTAADAERNPSINRADIDAILTAEGLTDAEKLAKLQGLTAPTIEDIYTPDAPHTPIVPDNPATVRQQLELALDPASARKAVLFTPGTQIPQQLPVRLRRYEGPRMMGGTQHGEVWYNPNKISANEVAAAINRPDFDARILGMSQFSKPGDPEAVAVTTARKKQPNVQAEAAAGESIPAAVAAAEKANPGEPVTIKPPEQVLQERQTPTLAEQKQLQKELDEANLSAKGYGEDEIAGRVGDKRANLLGGISRSLEAGGHEVTIQPTENLYTTPEDSRPRFGLQSGNKVEYGTSAHAAPHEAVHAIYEGLPKSEQARLDAAVTRSPEFQRAVADDPGLTAKEFLAQRGSVELVRQIQEKDFGLWRDLAMQVRRMFNMDTPQDAMRFINNAFTASADRPGGSLNVNRPKPLKPLKQVGPTYQRFPGYDKAKGVFAKEVETNEKGANVPKAVEPETAPAVNYSTAQGVFATELEKQARTAKPWGLLPDRNGRYSAEGLVAKFNMQGKVEREILPGFIDWVKSRGGATKEELVQYAKEHEPRAEVHDYGMDREESAAKKELDALTHNWLDTRDAGTQEVIQRAALSQERHNKRGVEEALATLNTPADIEQARRYLQLTKQVSYDSDVSVPTATSFYNQVSPKAAERPMPSWVKSPRNKNLERVDVTIPLPKVGEREGQPVLDGDALKWQQDDLHENLPNTLGWAAIQYETGPNGERIAHIMEAQSRWGQEMRNRTQAQKDMYGDAKDHPLLRDYNRLIIKAAIEQARKQGATHIAISDAETAMMTEMHDQHAEVRTTLTNYDSIAAKIQDAWNKQTGLTDFKVIPNLAEHSVTEDFIITRNGVNFGILERATGNTYIMRNLRSALEQALHERHPSGHSNMIDSPEPFQWQRNRTIEQEGGMRFNYDPAGGQLHKIAQQLTGAPGEDINFGEHKNAMYKAEYGSDVETVYKPRPDLILKNPDGTPKTTATGRLYPIDVPAARREAGEPFTYGRANYSTPVKGPKVPDDFKTSDVRGFSLIDKISNAPLRQSANEAQAEKSRLLGYGYKAVRDNKAALKEADLDKMADAFNGKSAPLTDTASQAVYKMFRTAADWINSNGPARTIVPKDGYVPQMFHPEVRQVFKDAVNSPDAKAIKAALVAHYQKAMSRPEAVKAVDELATAIHTNPSYDPSTDFGPLHKAAGMGLPAEVAAPSGVIRIRDNDMLRVTQTYFARAATDLAYHNAITKRFGANGGELSKGNFQRWRQSFTGQPESDADQLLRSSMRAGSSVVVSTLSGLNNIAAIPQQAMAFTGKHGPFTTAAALIDTITAPRASHEASIAAGHTRPGQNDMTFKQTRDTNLAAAVLDASADTMRLITGSTALENISRAWTYNIGKRAARNMIDAGDHDKMLRLGVQPSDPKAEEKLAASIANHIEGTYDGRELPGPLVEGKLGALLSIHKWSIEKMNSAYKDLYVPATKGDLWPLLWTVAMAAGVTIPAAKELKEAVNRKKGAPELEEINAAEKVTGKKDWLARTAWLTQLLSMASIAGYASQAANAVTQTAAGRKDQNLVFVPLSELAGEELSNLVGNASQALRKGEDLDTIGPQFAKDLLKIMVQGSQAVLNRLPGQEANVQAASDNRDLAVYNNLVNKKMPSEARANDLDGALEREFKQEQDPVKAGELLRKIAARYREKFKDDPFMLAAKLRSLREMNGIGFPTEGNEAGRYKQYLDEAYGPEGASNRVRRAAYRDALNRSKVEALDKGGMKPPPAKPNPFRK